MTTTPAATRMFNMFFHLLTAVIVFALLAPLFGWIVVFVSNLVRNPSSYGSFMNVVVGFFGGLPLAYLLGTMKAAFAGLVVGVGQLLIRRFGVLHALVVGLAAGLLFLWKPGLLALTPRNAPPSFDGKSITLALAGLLPTLACWFLIRRQRLAD